MNTTECFLAREFICGAKGAVCDDAFCVRAFRMKVGVYVVSDCARRCPFRELWYEKKNHIERTIDEVL